MPIFKGQGHLDTTLQWIDIDLVAHHFHISQVFESIQQ